MIGTTERTEMKKGITLAFLSNSGTVSNWTRCACEKICLKQKTGSNNLWCLY